MKNVLLAIAALAALGLIAAGTASARTVWRASPDPTWGLRLLDANIELGNLVSLVHREANAYAARPAAPLAPASDSTSH